MASVTSLPDGKKRVQFVAPGRNRKTIHLGKVDKRYVESVRMRADRRKWSRGESNPRQTGVSASPRGGDTPRSTPVERNDLLREVLQTWPQLDPADRAAVVAIVRQLRIGKHHGPGDVESGGPKVRRYSDEDTE